MDAQARALSVVELYGERIAERGFDRDSAQLAAATRLDDLRTRLLAANHALGPPWRRWQRRRKPLRGLYLWGEVGRGKTWLMDLFVESLPGATVRRRHFHRFMRDAHQALKSLRHHADPLQLAAEQLAHETRVLCFDEFTVADIADAMILGGLLKGLFQRGVCLVATSNVPPHDLYRGGLQRERFEPAIELIERHVEIFELVGPVDYRMRRLTSAGVYLSATDPTSTERLRGVFEQMGGSDACGGSLEVEGRTIAVVRHSAAAVWFDFAALCATPRSPDDYIEIAKEFATVIVSNVPVLNALQDDEARRFITLVDELYDHNVNLILSAVAAPPNLYRGERLAREFQRTASRLVEMQSERYLAQEHQP